MLLRSNAGICIGKMSLIEEGSKFRGGIDEGGGKI